MEKILADFLEMVQVDAISFDERKVADICLDEGVVRLVLNIFEVGQVACIGQGIQIDDVVLRIFIHEETNNMGTDEAGTAGNEDVHHLRSWICDL